MNLATTADALAAAERAQTEHWCRMIELEDECRFRLEKIRFLDCFEDRDQINHLRAEVFVMEEEWRAEARLWKTACVTARQLVKTMESEVFG